MGLVELGILTMVLVAAEEGPSAMEPVKNSLTVSFTSCSQMSLDSSVMPM